MSSSVATRHRGVRLQAARASWAIEDIRLLRALAMQGVPIEAIAAQLGRTPSAVKNKAGMHGISLQGAGQSFARNLAK
jgi:hypothetical protein